MSVDKIRPLWRFLRSLATPCLLVEVNLFLPDSVSNSTLMRMMQWPADKPYMASSGQQQVRKSLKLITLMMMRLVWL